MPRNPQVFVVLVGLALVGTRARGQAPETPETAPAPFGGEWRTSFGRVKVEQKDKEVTGTYGRAGQNKIKGKVDGQTLTYEFQEGRFKGDAKWTLAADGLSFDGGFQVRGGRGGAWSGWRPDPEASKGEKPSDFSGLWLTSLGLMDLKQDGDKVVGKFALRGDSTIDGTVQGRELTFFYQAFLGGKGFFDLNKDGKGFAGAAVDDGRMDWFGWKGRPAPEFARHAALRAGKVVDGSTDNLLTYTVRAPEGYDPAAKKAWPTVVILHGSNMNARSYVETFAAAWPDLAREFILLGINGERPSEVGPDSRFNFSYANYMGKSTLGGYPGTDRESPVLVANALIELKAVYPVAKYLVGGHSQGGFLTYSLMMNYPDLVAGAFPVAAGLIVQCRPSVYADEALKAAQRKVPLIIVHSKADPVVDPDLGRYAADQFREAGFPAFQFLEPEAGGHMFALLPIPRAVRWLDALTGDDPARLLDFARSSLKDDNARDAVAALARARALKPDPPTEAKLKDLAAQVDALAGPKARELLDRIKGGKPGWVDDFLAFRDRFQFADSAKEVMAAFDDLRAQQETPAQKLYDEARELFGQDKADDGYKKYQQILDQYPASPLYRSVKRAVAERK